MIKQISAYLFGDSNYSINGITFAPTANKWYAVGSGPGSVSRILESDNGISWGELNILFDIGELLGCAGTDVATNRGHLVIISSTHIYEMYINGDWTNVTPVHRAPVKITYLSGTGFCVLTAGSSFQLSNDGVNWVASGPSTIAALVDLISATPGIIAYKAGALAISFDGGLIWVDRPAVPVSTGPKLTYNPALLAFFSVLVQTFPNDHYTINKSDFNADNWQLAIFTSSEGLLSIPVLIFHSASNKMILMNGSLSEFTELTSADGTVWDNSDITAFSRLLVYTGAHSNGALVIFIGNNGFGQVRGILTGVETDVYDVADFSGGFASESSSPPTDPSLITSSWDVHEA